MSRWFLEDRQRNPIQLGFSIWQEIEIDPMVEDRPPRLAYYWRDAMNARRLTAENRGASRRVLRGPRPPARAVMLDLSTIMPNNLDAWTGIIIENASRAHGSVGPAQVARARLMAARLNWVSHPRMR